MLKAKSAIKSQQTGGHHGANTSFIPGMERKKKSFTAQTMPFHAPKQQSLEAIWLWIKAPAAVSKLFSSDSIMAKMHFTIFHLLSLIY